MRTIRRLSILSSLFILCVLILMPGNAVGQLTARGLGMGGAYTALARGVHAPSWNPANLGLRDNPKFSFTFVSVGAGGDNNAFDFNMLNDYNGKYLTQDDIEDILSRIPDDGLDVNAMASVRALSFSTGRFAFSIGAEAMSLAQVAKTFFQLGLQGNTLDETYTFDDSDGSGLGYGMINLSWGQPIPVQFADVFSVGGTFRFLIAGAHAETDQLDGHVTTTIDGFDVDASYALTYTYESKMGFGMDIGAAAQWGDRWTMSLGLANVLGTIRLAGDITTETGFVRGDSLTVIGLSDDEDSESLLEDSSWTVKGVGDYSERLPLILRLGGSYHAGSVLLSADYHQAFSEGPLSTTTPRFAVGAEYHPLSWLPLRMGFVAGGKVGFATTFGFGIRPGGFVLDVGVLSRGFLTPMSSKGLVLGIELGLSLQRSEPAVARVGDF